VKFLEYSRYQQGIGYPQEKDFISDNFVAVWLMFLKEFFHTMREVEKRKEKRLSFS